MAAILKKLQHDLKVFSFEEIKSITDDFDKNNLIGEGGFGKVYKGVVDSDSKGQIMAAFKRLDRSFGQGNPEFLKEILMLSQYRHENLITLLGYCDKDPEKILVYEHAAHGSLDVHLTSPTLTWTKRLEICLGAARGLCYLHDPNKETQQRVIHRDIKSSNILLDENWNGKISDMGLSKIGSTNPQQSFLATNVVGTWFYLDPEYMETSILTKESDVYSFGVVLFEVLCGSLCFEDKNGLPQRLVRRWTNSYKEKKLEEIIFHHLKQGMDPKSLETFSEIAYRCLQIYREDRPYMSEVVEKLEIALHSQQEFSKRELEEMVKAALKEKELEKLLSERFFNKEISEIQFEDMVEAAVSKEELQMLVSKRFINKEEQERFLSKGVLVNGGNTWFSLNKNGEHCEMISGNCFDFTSNHNGRTILVSDDVWNWRFKERKQRILYEGFKTHARAQFLSPGITYAVNLVFKIDNVWTKYKYLRYTLAGESEFSTSFITHNRGDGWMMTDQLCHFICDKDNVDLDITFDCDVPMLVEGIEIRSLERVQHEQVLGEEEVDTHSDTYWKQKLPEYWEIILKKSSESMQWTTKKELYSIFCKGILIYGGKEWFSLANNGKICYMTSAREALCKTRCYWQSLPYSRFGETACDPVGGFHMNCRSIMLSSYTSYAAYLVYKLQENHSSFESPLEVRVKNEDVDTRPIGCYIYLLSPDQSPVIRGKVYQKKRIPQQRNDGWMEVPVYEFKTYTITLNHDITVEFMFITSDNLRLEGLIVEGIEFRPI